MFCSLFLFCSCSTAYHFFDSEPSKQVTVNIQTSEETNEYAPVYLLIKTTDFSHFLMDSYQKIAIDTADLDEDSKLLCLFPGTTQEVKITPTEDKAIAFYALFTEPGNNWKMLLNTTKEFSEINVSLGKHEIESIESR